MMDSARLYRAMMDGPAKDATSRWVFAALCEISRGRWRVRATRHPLGFVCIPVERSGDHGVCVHVWNAGLPRAGLTTSTIHSHSWDLVSHVLYGNVRNELIDVADAPDDPMYRVFEIHSWGDVDEVRETSRLVRCEVSAAELNRQGDTYSLDAGHFHATTVTGEAATVALGTVRPAATDLSLGGIDLKTHRVGRQRCNPAETALAARVVMERLASLWAWEQEG